MKIKYLAFAALAIALAGCSGNPLTSPFTLDKVAPPTTPGVDPNDPDAPVTVDSAIVIPKDLKSNMKSATFTPGIGGSPGTVKLDIVGLDTTPLNAQYEVLPGHNTPGFTTFYVQEDQLDRFFIALAATSADGSATAVVAGDGGQLNKVFQGVEYYREGGYTPPDATGPGPGRGQVSYKGKYAGLLNGGAEKTPPYPQQITRPHVPSEVPHKPTRVTGDVFMNANFADNTINGVVKNRNAIDLDLGIARNDPTSPFYNDGTGVLLEDVVMPAGDSPDGRILANGSFSGNTERPGSANSGQAIGNYGGVIGGANGSSIAGGIHIEKEVYTRAGELIEGGIERGVFVLDQCGLTTSGGDCVGTAP